jgi:hypothetical protein
MPGRLGRNPGVDRHNVGFRPDLITNGLPAFRFHANCLCAPLERARVSDVSTGLTHKDRGALAAIIFRFKLWSTA